MSSKNSINEIDQIATKTRPIFEKYKIQKALLFGSFANRRQSRKSDLDFILIRDTEKPYFERFEGILEELYQSIGGRDLDVFIYTQDELERIRHRKFIQKALQEAKVIYESR